MQRGLNTPINPPTVASTDKSPYQVIVVHVIVGHSRRVYGRVTLIVIQVHGCTRTLALSKVNILNVNGCGSPQKRGGVRSVKCG